MKGNGTGDSMITKTSTKSGMLGIVVTSTKQPMISTLKGAIMNNAEQIIQENLFLSIVSEAIRASDDAAGRVTVQETMVVDENGNIQGPYPICGETSIALYFETKNGYKTKIEKGYNNADFVKFLYYHFTFDISPVFWVNGTLDGNSVSWVFANGDQSYDRNKARAEAVAEILAKHEIIAELRSYHT